MILNVVVPPMTVDGFSSSCLSNRNGVNQPFWNEYSMPIGIKYSGTQSKISGIMQIASNAA